MEMETDEPFVPVAPTPLDPFAPAPPAAGPAAGTTPVGSQSAAVRDDSRAIDEQRRGTKDFVAGGLDRDTTVNRDVGAEDGTVERVSAAARYQAEHGGRAVKCHSPIRPVAEQADVQGGLGK
jgi:hypothetical protein